MSHAFANRRTIQLRSHAAGDGDMDRDHYPSPQGEGRLAARTARTMTASRFRNDDHQLPLQERRRTADEAGLGLDAGGVGSMAAGRPHDDAVSVRSLRRFFQGFDCGGELDPRPETCCNCLGAEIVRSRATWFRASDAGPVRTATSWPILATVYIRLQAVRSLAFAEQYRAVFVRCRRNSKQLVGTILA